MNREDIIAWAREAGWTGYDSQDERFQHFAALVAAAERNSWPAEMEAMERQVNILTDALAQAKAEEREECAKVCDELAARDKLSNYYAVAAKTIRARGDE